VHRLFHGEDLDLYKSISVSMNKLFYALVALLLGSASASAQTFTNTDFEFWTQVDTTWDGQPVYMPEGWSPYSTIKRTSDSYSGHYAAILEPYMSCGIAPGSMVFGSSPSWFLNLYSQPYDLAGCGAPVNFKPNVLSGHFKFDSHGEADSAHVVVQLTKFHPVTQQREIVAEGQYTFVPASEYTPFTVIVTDLQPGTQPDSIVVAFVSGMSLHFDTAGYDVSQLYIDNLSLRREALMGVNEEPVIEGTIFPNPSRSTLNVKFTSARTDDYTFILVDMAGRTLYKSIIFPDQVLQVNVASFSAGNYIGTISGKKGTSPFSRKIVIGEDCVY